MRAPDKVFELIDTFARNVDRYTDGRCNETQLPIEFLDPFFTELGWDVNNKQGYTEAWKGVIHEDAITIGSTTKSPDCCFRMTDE